LFRESYRLLALLGAFLLAVFLLYRWSGWKGFAVIGFIAFLLLAFTVYFFRDPRRVIPPGPECIVSPADGRVIATGEVKNVEGYDGPARTVAIFLSVWDVHVNRIPVDGKVARLEYRKGDFKRAYLSDASEHNEQTRILIDSPRGKVLVRQIAGILARRIVCRLREGDAVARGERFGMIKFGSRMELALPLSVQLRVSVGDKVKGGETIIGVFQHDRQ
jgi:phosphatidylserine decarboxylase